MAGHPLPRPTILINTTIKIFAHRGSSLIWPENTMLAFDKAHTAGATGFETDLRLSKDEEIVLSHDDNLARFGLPQATVSSLKAADICRLEISSRNDKYRDRMIRLRELLEKYPEKDYIFDCKISDRRLFARLQDLLSGISPDHSIWFLAWSRTADRHLRVFFPNHQIFPRVSRTTVWGWGSILGVGRILEPRNQVLALPAYNIGIPVFRKSQVSSIKKRRKTFLAYLANSDKDFRRCVWAGVDSILTDRPDLLESFCRKQRLR
ncbi:MAG: glycerophosphodiester phosphodiesterase [bacterium]